MTNFQKIEGRTNLRSLYLLVTRLPILWLFHLVWDMTSRHKGHKVDDKIT